jgi:hypothetical protein
MRGGLVRVGLVCWRRRWVRSAVWLRVDIWLWETGRMVTRGIVVLVVLFLFVRRLGCTRVQGASVVTGEGPPSERALGKV